MLTILNHPKTALLGALSSAALLAVFAASLATQASADAFVAPEPALDPGMTAVTVMGDEFSVGHHVTILAGPDYYVGVPVGGLQLMPGPNTIVVPTMPGTIYSGVSPTLGPVDAAVSGDDPWDPGMEL